MEEESLDHLLTVCSDKCKEAAELKLKTGEIKLPTYKIKGYSVRKIGKSEGY